MIQNEVKNAINNQTNARRNNKSSAQLCLTIKRIQQRIGYSRLWYQRLENGTCIGNEIK